MEDRATVRIHLSAIPGLWEGSVLDTAFSDVDHERKCAADCPPGKKVLNLGGFRGRNRLRILRRKRLGRQNRQRVFTSSCIEIEFVGGDNLASCH